MSTWSLSNQNSQIQGRQINPLYLHIQISFSILLQQYNLLQHNIQNLQKMISIKTQSAAKREYSRIPIEKKTQLVRLVFRIRVPLDIAIQQLGIKKTTAVNIINQFKDTGTLPKRKYKNDKKINQVNHHIISKRASKNHQDPAVPAVAATEPIVKIQVKQEQIECLPYQPFSSYFPLPLYASYQ